MSTKIKLRIRLFIRKGKPYLSLTYIDVDDRFNVSKTSEVLSYISEKTGMVIATSKWSSFGVITDNCITIPSADRLGYEISHRFETDRERYQFLKNLYVTLDEWSNYWGKFSTDSVSYITVKGNTWEIKFKKNIK